MHLIHDKDSISNLGRDMNFSKMGKMNHLKNLLDTDLPSHCQMYFNYIKGSHEILQ